MHEYEQMGKLADETSPMTQGQPTRPYEERTSCTPEDFFRIITGRRSVRAYEPHPLSYEQVMQLLEAARWAPSPHGRQPWRFVVLTRPEMRQQLASAMGDEWQRQLALDEQDAAAINQRLDTSYQRILHAPTIILPCLYLEDLDYYPDETRRATEHTMAVQSLGCAVQNMLLTAYSMGLDCGWMCAPLFCPDVVRAALNLNSTLIPHALITVGYAAVEPVRRPRRPLEELVIFCE
jgi:F420 biosynthesis protein FbiB-like protein